MPRLPEARPLAGKIGAQAFAGRAPLAPARLHKPSGVGRSRESLPAVVLQPCRVGRSRAPALADTFRRSALGTSLRTLGRGRASPKNPGGTLTPHGPPDPPRSQGPRRAHP